MDMVPKKRNDRYLWYKNISENLVTEAPKFGLAAADATAAKANVDALLAAMEATTAAQLTLDGARSTERTVETSRLATLRLNIRNWKSQPGFAASGSEGVLRLKGSAVADFDPSTYKPMIKVSIEAGRVKVDFEKKGVDGLAIYRRLRGQTAWQRIGTDTEPPYFDTGALAQPNVPEVREYMARGLMADEEVGQDSDIVSITYAG